MNHHTKLKTAMNTQDRYQHIAESYISYYEMQDEKRKQKYQWANDKLDALAQTDPESAINVIDIITELSSNDALFAYIGAGPIQDMLGSEHGSSVLETIVVRARKSPKWRFVFGCVWTSGFRDRAFAGEVEKVLEKYFPNGRP